jgi:hypothetical protein
MANARLLHKKGAQGERVIKLNHLEFRIWVQYVLSADDYGVMRGSASVLMADNPRLEQEPLRKVEAAMKAVVAARRAKIFMSGESPIVAALIARKKGPDHRAMAGPPWMLHSQPAVSWRRP